MWRDGNPGWSLAMMASFLDMQAEVGVTVHMGGLPMTRQLLSLCHAENAREILDVGCGIGVGPVHAAKEYGCRVVGIDRSERMIEWSRRRAREERVEERVELRVADVLALPFEDDRFDATVCESVLAFVSDKERAIGEMVRVTRPGGFVGLNEMCLLAETPPAQSVELVRRLGTEVRTLESWRALWDGSGLQDRVVRAYRVDVARELRSRLRWIGPRWLLRGMARLGRLYFAEPSMRPALGMMLGGRPRAPRDEPSAPSAYAAFGYALLVGRKPFDPSRSRTAADTTG